MPVSGTPKENVGEEMHRYKHGQLHSGPDKYGHFAKSRKQAIAIALNVAGLSRKKRQWGGATLAGREVRGMLHTGPIRSSVPGRTDHVPMHVPNGAYVLPSQHVSHLGQNNTEAAFTRLNHVFGPGSQYHQKGLALHKGAGLPSAPAGKGLSPGAPRMPHGASSGATGVPGLDLKAGGVADHGEDHVPIMAAGGEFVVDSPAVAAVGHEALTAQYGAKETDKATWKQLLKAGHDSLDHWVEQSKPKHIKTLQKLPGPEKQ